MTHLLLYLGFYSVYDDDRPSRNRYENRYELNLVTTWCKMMVEWVD
jgi:hypothetical protein